MKISFVALGKKNEGIVAVTNLGVFRHHITRPCSGIMMSQSTKSGNLFFSHLHADATVLSCSTTQKVLKLKKL